MMLVCSHCGKPGGCLHLVAVAGADVAAGQPAPAAAAPAAPAGQQQRQEDPNAPLCRRCGVNRVGQRRNGSWFATCYACG